MNFSFSVVFVSLLIISNDAFSASNYSDSVTYRQDVGLVAPFPKNYFELIKGSLFISNERVIFKAFKAKYDKYNFDISRTEVVEAKKWGAFIVPNPWFLPTMIKIKRKNE